MLEIANGWLTTDQEKTHFALWAAVKAPLILGCDLDKISKESLEIITNEELIAVNQDSLGRQAFCRLHCTTYDLFMGRPQVYAGPLANDETVVIVTNWGGSDYGAFEFNFDILGVAADQKVIVRDMWTRSDVGVFSGKY